MPLNQITYIIFIVIYFYRVIYSYNILNVLNMIVYFIIFHCANNLLKTYLFDRLMNSIVITYYYHFGYFILFYFNFKHNLISFYIFLLIKGFLK